MPGQNILGLCTSERESPQEFTALSVSFSVNGALSSHVEIPGGGESDSITTLNFSHTFNYSRIPFIPTGAEPSDGQMWITQQGCCCPCRYDLNIGGVQNRFDFETGVAAIQTITDTPEGGGDPTVEHHTISGAVFALVAFRDGVEQTTGRASIPCRNTDEGNRNLMQVFVDYTNTMFVTNVIEQDDYSQSLEVDGAEVFFNSQTPGILEVELANDLCEGNTFTAVSSWLASATVGNQTEDFGVTCSLEVTLS